MLLLRWNLRFTHRAASTLLVALLGTAIVSRATSEGASTDAKQKVSAALQAMGEDGQIRGLKSMGWKGMGHRFMREQSERPTGPWLLDYFQISQLRDLEHHRLREERQSRGCDSTECWRNAEWQSSVFVLADDVAVQAEGGKFQPARAEAKLYATDLLTMAPEQLLLEALGAGDLKLESPVIFHGFRHDTVSFHRGSQPVRIFLNPTTHLPAAAEITRTVPNSVFWGPWGDFTTRFVWTFWQREPSGFHYPRQWDAESNGRPDWTLTINEIALNPQIAAEQFAIPAQVAEAIRAQRSTIDEIPFGRPDSPAVELAAGVVQIPANFNVEEVRADEGIYIIEGPTSNGYSRQTMEDAQRRFPGSPIKGVITTSDAWPHIGGLREYVARGVPIYALDLNEPILQDLFAAQYVTVPDNLAKNPRKPVLRLISGRTPLGQGENRMELVPIRTQTGERQMFVYFPGRKFVYTSDLFQKYGPNEYFLPQTVSEAVDAVRREHLAVEKAFGMHLAPTPWKAIEDSIAAPASTVPAK